MRWNPGDVVVWREGRGGRGRYARDEVAAARAEGERVLAEWPFQTGWEGWEPGPSRPVPALPDGWED